jgi:hypothetical protein
MDQQQIQVKADDQVLQGKYTNTMHIDIDFAHSI